MSPRGSGEGAKRAFADDLPPWLEVVESAIAGDATAYARLTRLVTGYLTRWRAFDFEGEWDDMVQDVLMSSFEAVREGRVENARAYQAFVRNATRFKTIDRIRAAGRWQMEREGGPRGAQPTDDGGWPPVASLRERSAELRTAVRGALGRLDERERAAVVEVHLLGRTYDEAAESSGIPLGSLKRALRTGLAKLRTALAED